MALLRLAPMLEARDLAATVAFYTEVLGFTLTGCWPTREAPTWVALEQGPVRLTFTRPVGARGSRAPQLTGALYLHTDDALAVHARVKGRAEVLWGPELYPHGMREFAIADPDGYTLAFGEEVPPEEPAAGGKAAAGAGDGAGGPQR